jgi:sRNA-binding protein
MRTDATAVLRTLAERWPKTFFPESKKRKPLKVGILEDLTAAAPDINRKMLRLALRMYTTTDAYLFACSKGHKRIDLNGNEVEEISERDKARASEILEVRKNKGAGGCAEGAFGEAEQEGGGETASTKGRERE